MRSVPYGKRILTVLLLGLLCLIYIAARIAQVSAKNLQTSSNFVCNYGLLPKLAALHGCTKLNTHDNYFDAYENIFCNLRNRNNRIRLIEFGVWCYKLLLTLCMNTAMQANENPFVFINASTKFWLSLRSTWIFHYSTKKLGCSINLFQL